MLGLSSTNIFGSENNLLHNKRQIDFDSLLKVNQWGLVIMTTATILVSILFETQLGIDNDTQSAGSAFLVPIQIFVTFLMLFRPSILNLGIAYSLIVLCQIGITLWHIFHGTDGLVHGVIVYSIGYMAFSVTNITIIPKPIYVLMPIFLVTLFYLFFQHTDKFDSNFNSTIIMGFSVNICSMGLVAFVAHRSNFNISNLLEKQRNQLMLISSDKKLLETSLKYSNQTLFVQDELGVRQFPSDSKFSNLTSDLSQKMSLLSTLNSMMAQKGYRVKDLGVVCGGGGRDVSVYQKSGGRSYLAHQSPSPKHQESTLLTDIINFTRSHEFIDAALNASKIGVCCYDELGQLQTSSGAYPDEIPRDAFTNLKKLEQMVLGKEAQNTYVSHFQIGSKFFDFSFMQYGDVTLVTHIDVTADARRKMDQSAEH